MSSGIGKVKRKGGVEQMDYGNQWGKHYDVAVCAVLLSTRHHLGEIVTSDGDWTDEGWMRGRAIYARVTGRLVESPWKVKECKGCGRTYSVSGHSWGGCEVCATRGCKSSSWRGFDGKMHCTSCGKTRRKRIASMDLCYFCSHAVASAAAEREEVRS